MELPLIVHYRSGEKEEITGYASDIIMFEDRFNISFSKAAQDLRVTWLMYLGYAPTFAAKKTALSFEDWSLTVSEVKTATPKK